MLGMVGSSHPKLIGAAQAASTGLIGAMPEGGAQVIASRGQVSPDDEMLDRAAMEMGTD
jgi:argininosuccinate synthase